MYDFLYTSASGIRCATRDASPFAKLDREYRVPALPSAWKRNGEAWVSVVEYAGEQWTCFDGSIIPAEPRPKVISKLDLLLVLREMDKTAAFFAWLDGSGLREFWAAAQDLATNHPLFEKALQRVCAALDIAPEEAEAILRRIGK